MARPRAAEVVPYSRWRLDGVEYVVLREEGVGPQRKVYLVEPVDLGRSRWERAGHVARHGKRIRQEDLTHA